MLLYKQTGISSVIEALSKNRSCINQCNMQQYCVVYRPTLHTRLRIDMHVVSACGALYIASSW